MFQLDTFRLSMNRYRDCFVQRKNLKIISAYPNFHIFRRRAFSYYRFFPGIRSLPRICYTCIQILALLDLPFISSQNVTRLFLVYLSSLGLHRPLHHIASFHLEPIRATAVRIRRHEHVPRQLYPEVPLWPIDYQQTLQAKCTTELLHIQLRS